MNATHCMFRGLNRSVFGIALFAATLGLFSANSVQAKESPAPTGSFKLITNPVWDAGNETGLQAGYVTVRSYASGSLVFDSADAFDGWDYEVKSSGGTSDGDRVVVEFFHDLLNGKVSFMIEPGRLIVK